MSDTTELATMTAEDMVAAFARTMNRNTVTGEES